MPLTSHTAGPEDRRYALDASECSVVCHSAIPIVVTEAYSSASLNIHTRTEASSAFRVSSDEIGCSLSDTANAISHAVINQTICNSKRTPQIMDAFEILATHDDTQNFFGAEEAEKLQSSFVTLKSSGFPNSGKTASRWKIEPGRDIDLMPLQCRGYE
jgi:hypothetical protein